MSLDGQAQPIKYSTYGFIVGREHALDGVSSPMLSAYGLNGGLITKPWHPSQIDTMWMATRNHRSDFAALDGNGTDEERSIFKRLGDVNGNFYWFNIPVGITPSYTTGSYFRDYKERPQGYYGGQVIPVMMEEATGVSVETSAFTPGGTGSGPTTATPVKVTKSAGADDRQILPIFDVVYRGEVRDPNNPNDDEDRYFTDDYSHQADPRIPLGTDDTHAVDRRMRKMIFKGQDDMPGGTPGIVVCATREDQQVPIFFPIVGAKIPGMDENANALIIHHREEGPAKMSTLYSDIKGNNRDGERTAGLQGSLALQKISRMPGSVDPTSEFYDPTVDPAAVDFSKSGGATCTLNYAKSGDGVGAFGLKTAVGDGQSGDIKSNDFTGAFGSWVRSGYEHAGNPGGDKHDCGITLDGQPINSDHIWTNGYFYMDPVRDAPLHFETTPWEDAGDRGVWRLVHLRYDGNMDHGHWTGNKPGMWRLEVRTPEIPADPDFIPYEPPTDDIPVTGGGGGDQDIIIPGGDIDLPGPIGGAGVESPIITGTGMGGTGSFVADAIPGRTILGKLGPEMSLLPSTASYEQRIAARQNLGPKPPIDPSGTGNASFIPDATSPNLNGILPTEGWGWEPSRRYETFAGPQFMGIAIAPRDYEHLLFGRFNVDTKEQIRNWEASPLSASISAFGSIDGEEWDYDTPQDSSWRRDRPGRGRFRLKGIAKRGGWFIHSPAIDLQDQDYQSEDTPECELIVQADNGSIGLGYPGENGQIKDGIDFITTARDAGTGYRDLHLKSYNDSQVQDTGYDSTFVVEMNLDVKGSIETGLTEKRIPYVGPGGVLSTNNQLTYDYDTNESTFGGDLSVGGKLTVTGLIDPTGLQFDVQASQPAADLTLWANSSKNNDLYWTNADGNDHKVITASGTATIHGQTLNITHKALDYIATVSDDTITTSGSINVNLASIGTYPTGKVFTVKHIGQGGNSTTIATLDSAKIDLANTKTVGPMVAVRIQSDGTNWWVL